MRYAAFACVLALTALIGACSQPADQNTQTQSNAKNSQVHDQEKPAMTGPLHFTMKSLDGKDVDLSTYKGNVVMIVNTASKCGLTPQYAKLEALNKKYHDQGLRILGFPANNFAGQEPGSDEQIAAFCQQNYGVDFDMFSKISVKGDDQAPLYRYLTSESTNGPFAGEITWNFEKFLVDKSGKVIARFAPRTTPDDPEVVTAIETALAQ